MNALEARRRLLMMMADELPGYRRVEYLESSKVQYIDTGMYYEKNDRCVITFSPLESGVDLAVFGCYGSGVSIAELGYITNHIRFDVTTTSDGRYVIGQKYTAEKNGNLWTFDGVTYNSNHNDNVTDHSLLLFGRWYQGVTKLSKTRIHTYQHYRNGDIVQNLVPCVRKSDDKPGMYDTVTKTFFTNSGTGEFIVPS